MEIYRVENLTFRYPTAEKNALEDISFSVKNGEFITICGVSGSGKSTILRQLKTVLQPYGDRHGKIYFCGKNLCETDLRTQAEKIGFVMQSPDNQSVTDKVWHELAFGLESLGMNNSVIRRRTAETAEFFGISKWFEKNVDELSGGQKQILNLASVMVMQPDVLILDEPTAQLDPIASENFISLLVKINKELGTTIILSEHSLNEIYGVSDRIIVMSGGKIISDTSPEMTAEKLYKNKNEVFESLPSVVRVYQYADGKNKTPLSVSDGRKWLERFVCDKNLNEIKINEYKNSGGLYTELKNVWFRYERDGDDILKGIDLKIYSGEILAVLGGNGAGKTTMLSVISGIISANRGKVSRHGKISVLPQNPQALFVKSSVEEDLTEISEDIESVVELCGLGGLLKQHPYDLSGGEQQRAALAKVLLTKPEILLLDEPTKGLDSAYKRQLAEILRELARNGTAIVFVSHDIEFCAEYADRCAMLFNGEIVSQGSPKEFFNDNGIYTTPINRMSREIIDNAVTVNDILYALGKEFPETPKFPEIKKYDDIKAREKKSPKKSLFRKIFSVISFLTAVFFMLVTADIIKIELDKIIAYGIMFVTAILFMIIYGGKSEKIHIIRKDNNIKKLFVSIIMIFLAVPATIFCGVYFLDNTKYLFISLLIMLESIVPFYVMFERRAVQARELVLISTICALCVSGRAVFYMIPEFKPVTALVIISGAVLGSETGFLIGSVTMLVSNIFFGQGAWTPFQMFTMGLIGFLSGIIYQRGILPQNRISLAVFGFAAAFIIYGGIMNPATILLSGTSLNTGTVISAYIFGLPVDTVHAVSTALFLYIGAEPIISKIERIKLKYGLITISNW